MARKSMTSPVSEEMPAELLGLLQQADQLLKAEQGEKALELVARARLRSPWLTNAIGVCRLRLGDGPAAVDTLRGLVIGSGGLCLRPDVPTVFKSNFAAALALTGNVDGCLSILSEIRAEDHPAVQKLRAALRHWQAGLTFWERLRWRLGGSLDRPVALGPDVGDLWDVAP